MEEKQVLMIRIRAGEEKKRKRRVEESAVELALLKGRDRGGARLWVRTGQAVWHGKLFRSTLFGERARTTAHWNACSLGKKVWFAALVDCGTAATSTTTTTPTTNGFALLLLLLLLFGESHSNERTEKHHTPAHHVGGKQGRERRRVGSAEE